MSLTSDQPAATVLPSVTVLQGAMTATFTVTTTTVSYDTLATITATAAVSKTAVLTVLSATFHGTVTGTVVSSSTSQALSGARVRAVGSSSCSIVGGADSYSALADQSGFFTLTLPVSVCGGANYYLTVSMHGYNDLTVFVNNLWLNETRNVGTVSLVPLKSISGSVIDSSTSLPLRDVAVSFSGSADPPVMTDVNGNFTLPVPYGGTFTFKKAGYVGDFSFCPATNSTTTSVGTRGLDPGVGTKVGCAVGDGEEWRVEDQPFTILDGTSLRGSLTIDAGITVKFPGVSSYFSGKILGNGTAANPIVFTAASGSTAGSWGGISLYSGSSLNYAQVSYAGSSGSPVTLSGSGISVDHLTVSTSAHGPGIWAYVALGPPVTIRSSSVNSINGDGISVEGPLVVTDSSVTGCTGRGVAVYSSLSWSGGSITNNGAYAIEAMSLTAAVSASGTVTVSGNGGGSKDGISFPGGTRNASFSFSPSIPWHVQGTVTVAAGATLTAPAGTTVKMANDTELAVYGVLVADGTLSSPITFTSQNANPAPGAWRDIGFLGTQPGSRISYSTISMAGGGGGAIVAQGPALALDHVTITSSSTAGIYSYGSPVGSQLTVTDSSVRNNAGYGMDLYSNTATVTDTIFDSNAAGGLRANGVPTPARAALCYWSSPSGPSGAGTGTGQSVSAGVLFEPWLRSAPSPVQYFSSLTYQNRTFNPNLGTVARLAGSTTLTGTWSVKIFNSSSVLVRTFTGSGTALAIAWDGKDQGGVAQPAGTYFYQADATATTGELAATAQGSLIIDTARQLTISAAAATPSFFSPNGDGVQDGTAITAVLNYDDANWTVTMKNSANQTVRSGSGTGNLINWSWDGRDGTGIIQPDGVYTAALAATDGTAVAGSSITLTLDNTPPTAVITAPADGQVLSFFTTGAPNVAVIGSTADLNFTNWTLDFGSGASPTAFTALSSGTSPVTNATLGTWPTAPLANGLYTLRLQAWDEAGNHSVVLNRATVANFTASQDVLQLNAPAGGAVTFTSILPLDLTETLVLKNAAGQVVRTLVNAIARGAGTYSDVWNGRDDSGGFLPDGPYFYVATVTDGTHTFTWDLSAQYLSDYSDFAEVFQFSTFDPFNNQPLGFSYNFSQPGRVSVIMVVNASYNTVCTPRTLPPNFCPMNAQYEEAGPHTVSWAGVDASGRFRPEVIGFGVSTDRAAFAKNAVVLFGTRPTISNLVLSPPLFGPAVSAQAVSFDLGTFQNSPATVTISFLSEDSLSTLRTVTLPSQPPGHVTATWDGRADNGMLVAPGFYLVTVTARDPLGNSVSRQLFATVIY